jgi:hypothetical protein
MPSRTFLVFLLAAIGPLSAQDGLQPPYDIPSCLAKVPEKADFYGSWLRGDGGYRIEIEASEESPTGIVARYFNPNPIHVELARFEEGTEDPVLTIVLRDEGYPGSTYELIFLAERQVLIGNYARPGSAPAEVYFLKGD